MFVRRDYKEKSSEKERTSRMLAPKSDGPHFVKQLFPTTAAVQVDDWVEYINLDRLAPAPGPIVLDLSGPSSSEIAQDSTSKVDTKHVVQRVIGNRLVREKGVIKRKPRYE